MSDSTRFDSSSARKSCPFCGESILAEAIKCRYCGSRLDRNLGTWYRSAEEKRIAGVCGGLSEELGIPVTLLRLAFVLTLPIGMWSVVVYIVLWIIMPVRPRSYERGDYEYD